MLLETAVFLSGTGNAVAAVAIPWLVLERTGRPTAAAIVGAATALPLLFSALFSGAAVDMLGRRRASVIADVLSAVSVMAIPLVDSWIGLDLTLIALFAAIGSVFDPAGATAREAMLPDATAAAGWKLERVNSVHEAVWGIAYMAGPGLGGLLIATVGAAGSLWLTAGGFAASAIIVALIRAPGTGRPQETERPSGLLRGVSEGLAVVRRDRLLLTMTVLVTALIAVYMPVEGVVLPVIFERRGEPLLLGGVLTAMSAGAIAGALLYGALAHKLRKRRVFSAAMVLASLSILGMSLAPSYGTLVAFAIVAGFFWGPVTPLLNLAMQTRTPPAKRGRVLGVVLAAEYAGGPIGYVIAGPVAQSLGPEATFVGIGVAITVVAIVGSLVPALADLDAAPQYVAELTMFDQRPPMS